MSLRLVILLTMGALFTAGCNSTCSNLQKADEACGITFDDNTCNNNIGNCSDADQQIINDAATCLSNPQVCADGKELNTFSAFQCQDKMFTLDSPCEKALGN